MREREFRVHLETRGRLNGAPFAESTINSHIRKVKAIETRLAIRLDTEFTDDNLTSRYDYFEYTAEQARNGGTPEHLVRFGIGAIGTANGYRNSIKNYRIFCEAERPAPIEAD